MKKIIAIATFSLVSLFFIACGESSSNYVGYWQFPTVLSAARTLWTWNT